MRLFNINKYLLVIIFLLFTQINELLSNTFTTPIVFVSRNHQTNGNLFYPQAGLLPGMGGFSRFTVTGGRLMVRESDGTIRTLIDSTMIFGATSFIDVQQPCVHWNGEKIIFAGIEHRDSSWRIYEINKAGTRIKRITFTDRNIDLSQFGPAAFRFVKYDDIDPVYLPDGRIIFASTRYPSLSMIGALNTTNLYITDTLSSFMYRVTSERNGAEKPSINPVTGRIMYSRWWVNLDRPSNLTGTGLTRVDSLALTTDIGNIWQTNMVNPDGDNLTQYATDARTRKSFFSYRPRILPNGDMLSVYIPYMPMLETGGSPGIRYYKRGFSEAEHVIGVDSTTPLYVNSPPSTGTMQPPYATDPLPLPDGNILFSYATTVVEQDYGIYTCDINGGNLTKVVDFPGTLELNAEIFAPKVTPPRVSYLSAYDTNRVPPTTNPATFYQGGLFRFDCMNVYSNAPVDAPIDDAPPIKKNAKFRFFMNFQRQDPEGKDHPILFREIALDRDGKVAEGDMVANVSLFEQIVDSAGNILVNKRGNIAHVPGMNFGNDGSGTKCVGCHAGHTMITVPPNVTESSFTNLSTSASVRESSYRDAIYKGQNVVDRKARNNDLKVNWVAQGSVNEYVVLKWEIPIDIRRITLYDIKPNAATGTDIHVTDSEIFFYWQNAVANHIASTGPLSVEGTTLEVSKITTVDSIKIIVKNYTGNINSVSSAGLAEVELNARVSSYDLTGINEPVVKNIQYELQQNYPNPFNPATVIKYSIPKTENVTMEVFDVTGRSVALLISGKVAAGNNSISFNAANLPSGIYFYKLTAGSFTMSRKMILLK